MKHYVIHDCQIRGHIYRAGDTVDLSEAEYPRYAASLRSRADATHIPEEPIEADAPADPAKMTRAQLMKRLDDFSIGYPPKASLAELQKAFADATSPVTSYK